MKDKMKQKRTNKSLQKTCYICKGITLYSRAMHEMGKKPYCIGKEMELTNPYEIQQIKETAQKERLSKRKHLAERHHERTYTSLYTSLQWLNPFKFRSDPNIQWNYMYLPSTTGTGNAGGSSGKPLKSPKEIYISPLQYLFLRPPDKKRFVVYCFGKTMYEETVNGKMNYVPNLLVGFHYTEWTSKPSPQTNLAKTKTNTASTIEDAVQSIELWTGDCWLLDRRASSTSTASSSTQKSQEKQTEEMYPSAKPKETHLEAPVQRTNWNQSKQYHVRDLKKPGSSNWFLLVLGRYKQLCDKIALHALKHAQVKGNDLHKVIAEWRDRSSKR